MGTAASYTGMPVKVLGTTGCPLKNRLAVAVAVASPLAGSPR